MDQIRRSEKNGERAQEVDGLRGGYFGFRYVDAKHIRGKASNHRRELLPLQQERSQTGSGKKASRGGSLLRCLEYVSVRRSRQSLS